MIYKNVHLLLFMVHYIYPRLKTTGLDCTPDLHYKIRFAAPIRSKQQQTPFSVDALNRLCFWNFSKM